MCILGLHLAAGAGGGLLLAHTRDEALQRATTPPRLDASGVLCARDALGGGTWLGVHRGSRLLVALTNVRRRIGELFREALADPRAPAAGALNARDQHAADDGAFARALQGAV